MRVIILITISLLLFGCPKKTPAKKPLKFNSSTIIYSSNEPGNMEIFAIGSNGKNKINLTKNKADDYFPAWSSKRDKIAFTSGRTGDAEIYIMNTDGSAIKNLTNSKAEDLSPAFSPDGKYITFSSTRGGIISIYRMNSDGSRLKRLTDKHTFHGPAVFLPDGKRLILKREFNDPPRVEFFISDINGNNRRKMDPLKRGHEDPLLSKDGKEFVFSALDQKTSTWQLFSVDAATGQRLKRLTHDRHGYFSTPFFSPDGKKIVYTRREKLGTDNSLWLMNSDGSEKERITPGTLKAHIGVFSEDGRFIATVIRDAHNRNEYKWNLALIDSNNYKIRRLTNHDATDKYPVWFRPINNP